jgi:selenocysteine lyase/cysteine desulfurase
MRATGTGTTGTAAGTVRPLPVQRELFDIPAEVAYFNCASLAPQLRTAAEASAAAVARRARPWLIGSDDWFSGAEERRALFARLAGVDPEGVALVPATSYGLAVAAANLTARPGQRVLVLAEDYPSNTYTWRRFARRTGATVTTIGRRDGQTWAEAVVEALDGRTAVVAVLAAHWTDGGAVDLAAIGARARAVGAALVVDASQALGAMPLDLAAVQPDYLVTVGYKWLLGPFGLGYLYVAERHRHGVPLEENWINRVGSDDFAGLVDYQDNYQPGARRFDVGQRTHFETTPMAIVALRQLLDWGVPDIAATLGQVTARIEREVAAIGLALTSRDRGPHMLGISLPDGARRRVAAALAQTGVFAGLRGSSLRVSPHLWTTEEDVDRLVGALAEATKGGP